MRVTAQNGVNAAHTRGHFQINIHAVVTQQHNSLRPFGSGIVDGFLHFAFANTERPVGHQPSRVGNRCVRKSLTDDGDAHAIYFFDHIRFEYRITKITGFDVLGQKVNLARKVTVHNFFDARFAISEVPVTSHDVNAQQLAGIDHVLAFRPQRRSTALPRVPTVEQQSAGAGRF